MKKQKRITITDYLARGPKNPDHCTVGDLKKLFKEYKLEDSTPVLFERILDYYFVEGGWETVTHLERGMYPLEEGDDSECADEYIEAFCGGIRESKKDDSKAVIICGHY